MSIFTFKAYNPGKGKFIDIESDNSKVSISSESQQASISPSSGVRNASVGLLALNSYARNIYDPFSPSIVHPIPSSSTLLDNRDPQIPFLSRPPAQVGRFSFDKPSYSLPPVSALPPDPSFNPYTEFHSSWTFDSLSNRPSPRSTASPTLYASRDASFTFIVARLVLSSPAMVSRPFSLFMERANVAIWTVFLV